MTGASPHDTLGFWSPSGDRPARGAHDLPIAATARASNRVVITVDEPAFEDLPGVTFETHRSSH
jgi:predicted nucleic acid-binding protein